MTDISRLEAEIEAAAPDRLAEVMEERDKLRADLDRCLALWVAQIRTLRVEPSNVLALAGVRSGIGEEDTLRAAQMLREHTGAAMVFVFTDEVELSALEHPLAARVAESEAERDLLGRQQQALLDLAQRAEAEHRLIHHTEIYRCVTTDPGDDLGTEPDQEGDRNPPDRNDMPFEEQK